MADRLRQAQDRVALAYGSCDELCRPCVDCSLCAGCFCEGDGEECYAADRMPHERWADNQLTPLCTACDRKHDMCHFCRGIPWVMPPAHRDRNRHLPAREGPPPPMDGPIYYLAPEGGQPHQGQLVRAPIVVRADPKPAGPAPKPKGPPMLVPTGSGPKAAPTVGYVPPDPGDHPRAKPKPAPLPESTVADPRSEAFRQTEA